MRIVVTGAFSYIGAAVAAELVRRGHTVRTLTNRRPPATNALAAAPLRFEAEHLVRELSGADVLVNTYWIRLPMAGQTFAMAVERSRMLIDAAVRAKVGRLVQVSVSNAAAGRNLGYYAGKADVEEHVRAAGLSHAIVRPTLVVGERDVLTNNIAWFLRRFPIFPLPDGGRCRLQPVTLADTGRIAADAALATENLEIDAAGPDTLTFAEYVAAIAAACGVRRRLPAVPGAVTLVALRILGWLLGDVVLTREELAGLKQELLVSHAAPLGLESVPTWLAAHGAELGRRYVNDRWRHFGSGRQAPIL